MTTSMVALATTAGFERPVASALFGPRRARRLNIAEFPFETDGDRIVALALARMEAFVGNPAEVLAAIAHLLGGANRSILGGPRSIAAPADVERHPPVITSRGNAGHLLAGQAGLVIDLGHDVAPRWGRVDHRRTVG